MAEPVYEQLLEAPSIKQSFWSIRNQMAALACLGLANVYAMRVNLSSAVEPMQVSHI